MIGRSDAGGGRRKPKVPPMGARVSGDGASPSLGLASQLAKKAIGAFKGEPKAPVNKLSQAGDLGAERSVMRQVARVNNIGRAQEKADPERVTSVFGYMYRDPQGKLKQDWDNWEVQGGVPVAGFRKTLPQYINMSGTPKYDRTGAQNKYKKK